MSGNSEFVYTTEQYKKAHDFMSKIFSYEFFCAYFISFGILVHIHTSTIDICRLHI